MGDVLGMQTVEVPVDVVCQRYHARFFGRSVIDTDHGVVGIFGALYTRPVARTVKVAKAWTLSTHGCFRFSGLPGLRRCFAFEVGGLKFTVMNTMLLHEVFCSFSRVVRCTHGPFFFEVKEMQT